eukprot:2973945-Pleurochrysis_carterae.AAC.1
MSEGGERTVDEQLKGRNCGHREDQCGVERDAQAEDWRTKPLTGNGQGRSRWRFRRGRRGRRRRRRFGLELIVQVTAGPLRRANVGADTLGVSPLPAKRCNGRRIHAVCDGSGQSLHGR